MCVHLSVFYKYSHKKAVAYNYVDPVIHVICENQSVVDIFCLPQVQIFMQIKVFPSIILQKEEIFCLKSLQLLAKLKKSFQIIFKSSTYVSLS